MLLAQIYHLFLLTKFWPSEKKTIHSIATTSFPYVDLFVNSHLCRKMKEMPYLKLGKKK